MPNYYAWLEIPAILPFNIWANKDSINMLCRLIYCYINALSFYLFFYIVKLISLNYLYLYSFEILHWMTCVYSWLAVFTWACTRNTWEQLGRRVSFTRVPVWGKWNKVFTNPMVKFCWLTIQNQWTFITSRNVIYS